MKKRLLLNTISSVLLQIVTVVCGFILPRLILGQFGSEVNGLVQSITRFLSIISFLELGVGYVIQSALYKPLLDNDTVRISEIVCSGSAFFSKIARVLFFYVLVLIILFPLWDGGEFTWLYTTTLILAISISYFAQYYFGLINRLLLNADQRGYIQYFTQIGVIIANTLISVILIKSNQSIQVVKLASSLVYLAGPLYLKNYVDKYYRIDRKIHCQSEPLKQKWNGLAVHISQTVLNETDTIVLTILSTFSNVSIYSVYNLAVNGVKQLVITSTAGFDSIVGKLWAANDLPRLRKMFSLMEWWIHLITSFAFSCTYIMILPFVEYYTRNVNDANYNQPLFAALLIAANAGHCLRLPYNKMIIACGHFKQTQRCYIISAVLNIVISCLFVYKYGLIGVAIGTLIAMYYQTIWMAHYNSKNLVQWPFINFIKQVAVDVISVVIVILIAKNMGSSSVTFMSLILLSSKVAVIALLVGVGVNALFFHKNMKEALRYIIRRTSKDR